LASIAAFGRDDGALGLDSGRVNGTREERLNFTTISVTDSGPVRTIVLHRPDRRNAMTPAMQMELIAALEEVASRPCRVLVLAGAGVAFCSGLDLSTLKEMQSATGAEVRADAERIARLFLALYELPVPTIAAVHGPAIAGGAGLAILCDFTLATPEARFGFTEVRIGFVPALVSVFLTLQIGDKRSRDLLLTGRILDANEAFHLGLVNEIVPQADLTRRVESLAQWLLANSPQSLSATKRLIVERERAWLDASIANAIEISAQIRETEDFREGIAAFLEKRNPVWGK
jgi:methylglutaconyl-CoA hydratase